MNLAKLAETVETMILQYENPGFERRAFKLGLPESLSKASSKLYLEALDHPSIYVKLVALRWFQEKPGMGKNHAKAIAGLLTHSDPWVRLECLHALEKINVQADDVLIDMSKLLKDQDVQVRKAAAKALGKILKKKTKRLEAVVAALHEAQAETNHEVRWKVEKALRLLGEYQD
jgi:HEAT repeat protein